MADRDIALRGGGKIDTVIAGAIADDRAEFWHPVHHLAAERRSAGGDHRPYARELVGREHLLRRLADRFHQFEMLPEAHHLRLRETRIDQDLVGHAALSRHEPRPA